jgi:integrase
MGLFKRKGSPYYFMKFQANGIRIYESTKTANKKLAEEIYLNRRSEIIYGIEPQIKKEPVRDISFNELADKYLEFISGRLKSAYDTGLFVKTLAMRFKNKPLSDFTMQDLELFQSDWIKDGFSIAYANRLTATLKRMFAKALDWDLITEDVLKRVRKAKQLKGEKTRLRYLSEEEAERLIFNCDKNLKPIVITALNTGMRKSEILKLTWDRVDLKNRLILLDKTKNGERREIPVNDTLYNALSGLTRHLKTDYVFYNPETLKPYYDLKRSFGVALRKSHILDFRFHDLRHTFASRLVMKGIDLTTVKELLGHKDVKMTLRYAHLSKPHIRNAVNVLDGERCKIVAMEYEKEIAKD